MQLMFFCIAALLRIVSLAPALTEDLYAIGAGSSLVGIDMNSDRPAATQRLPRVGAMMGVSSEKIFSLHPTLVIGIAYQDPILKQLSGIGLQSDSFDMTTIADDLHTIRRLGQLTGHEKQADHLAASIQASLRSDAQTARSLAVVQGIVILGALPIYAAGGGTFLDEFMTTAHLRNVAHQAPGAWPMLSAESLLAAQPTIIILPSDVRLPATAPWQQLLAVRRGCLISLAPDDLLRPGPYVARTLHVLIQARHRLASVCRN